MSTESLKYAKFDHPKHGSYSDPQAVLDDPRLTETEKQAVLNEWRDSLRGVPDDHPDAEGRRSLDEAIQNLVSLKT